MKSKFAIGLKNTAHYTHLLHNLWTVMGIFNTVIFVSSLMAPQYKFCLLNTILFDYFKENLPIVDKIFYFSDGCAEKYKNLKKNYLFVTSSTRFQFGCRMDILCNMTKFLVRKSVRKISSTTFFSESHEETANVHADLEHCFVKSKIMSWTKSSHHFVPISCNKITHKLTSKDKEFLQFDFGKSLTREIDIKNIKCFVCQLYLWYILEGWHSDWRWLYMNVHEDGLKIEFLHFFFHLLLVNVLSQCQIFYASSQFQQ